ncbi:hypothetical protein [Streptomyces noursei]|uniref:hypothetical protein n=1 Tax=Streptomyces noursei TaxID=1971 RepID=UPI0016733A5B|nr:hypothetical protein [Streptomyces noursei]MCZ1021220.1 hypothetical protein [Streptomyces noursei]GGX53010.1 hypothetical protein GCM10010341_87880 [Streptomyces noursei]
MSRVHDPDADSCDCPILAEELVAALYDRDAAQRSYQGLREWTDGVITAVHAHPDSKKIMKAAAGRAGRR